ncbi:MAG: superoxide dismutase family protein [Balneolaceae bacterium]|nr:superoxide dismutase family protein [Balneolaceae bacterium]MBO6544818.1 superoxide dismutase family protein [Balneolaceae bacterium]MBO6646214.1 superoxide dismutase family protein [Balneolaceae bacterium]
MKFSFLPVLLFFLIACEPSNEHAEGMKAPSVTMAVSTVHPIGESGVSGTVRFESVTGGVEVTAELSGLEEGNHGFHIHQYGDCTASDGISAGGHFNPGGNEHSSPEAVNRHMGDMGNISANSDGKASLSYTDGSITIDQIIGRGVIVHAGEDDLTSQPSGAAGSRIACGVIGVVQQ